ncbi:MAG TPA: purine-nucleoside phosphorylase [Thermoanaerobaculia bacterium]|nr:purine-nucleoside phosphorylase [Thermoanaerobaculia bacterium]
MTERGATLRTRLDEAAARVREMGAGPASVGLILGSGLGGLARALSDRRAVSYGQIPNFPTPTGVVGHAGELVLGRVDKTPVIVLSGRIHFYEGRTMAEVVFPARLLVRLGVRAVILTNAAGGIRRGFRPGDLMLIADHINLFGTNPLIGENEDSLGPRFPDMSAVYDRGLRRIARATARRLRIPLREGVYLGNPGPSYETPAEIRAFARLGADAVGMSTVPEAIALAHASVRVLGISTITNMAAGILEKPLVHEEVLAIAEKVGDRFVRLLTELVPRVAAASEK